MPRTPSDAFLTKLADADTGRLGIRLAKVCVEANLPAAYVAVALESSRTTLYSWFRGKGVSEKKRDAVEAFMGLVRTDLQRNILPVKSIAEAKAYIENMLGGVKI